jgi:drug/metabolite transporter (DMT)-like permease
VTTPPISTTKVVLLFALCVVAFGLTWPVSKAVLTDATPMWVASGRGVLAVCVLTILLLARGELRVPPRGDWPIVLSIGGFQMTGFFALTQLGLVHVGAGRAAILAYTTILWVVPLSVVVLRERIDLAKFIGIALGLAGVAVLLGQFGGALHEPAVLRGGLFLLLAALSWGLAIIHARGHRWQSTPLQLLPWQFGTASIALVILTAIVEPQGYIGTEPRTLALMAVLGGFLSPFGSWMSLIVQRALPAIISSLGFLAAPVVGLSVSALWLGEPITGDLVVGGMLILGGIVIITLAGWRRQRAAQEGA